MSQTVIAIDGPAASGKGTVSKAISEKLRFNYLDTGKLYRAIGAKYLEGYQPIAAAESLESSDLAKYDLQKPEIAQAASEIASIPEVRAALLEFQRNFSQKMPGAVIDGRDIGTIVRPDAKIKIFLTASLEARAKRRYFELYKHDEKISFETNDKVKLILIGSISLILMQVTIHVGVNIRLFPTTGMTLPFLSYGGSSIISTSILAGIILNLTKRKIN